MENDRQIKRPEIEGGIPVQQQKFRKKEAIQRDLKTHTFEVCDDK